MEKKQTDQEQLESFITFCKQEYEYLYLKNYNNSVILYFKRSILFPVFMELIKTKHNFFIYNSIDLFNNYDTVICLFIYKKFNYEFN